MIELPRKMQQLYDLLFLKGEVAYADLVREMNAGAAITCSPQEWLGPYVSRLNRRLHKQRLRVIPGRTKQTYVMITVSND